MPAVQVSSEVVPWDFCFSAATDSLADEEGMLMRLDSFEEELESFCLNDDEEEEAPHPFCGAAMNEPHRKLRMQ